MTDLPLFLLLAAPCALILALFAWSIWHDR